MSQKSALVIVNQAPTDHALEGPLAVLSKASEGGALLMQDGVLYATAGHARDLLASGARIFVLRQSVEARGIDDRLVEGVELVDYHGAIDLVMDRYEVVL